MHRSERHLYSMTWSARTSNEGGTVRPSAFAVFKLITSANLSAVLPADRRAWRL